MNRSGGFRLAVGALLAIVVLCQSILAQEPAGQAPTAKYVFLFIGDGMGEAQVALTEAYQAAVKNAEAGIQRPGSDPLCMTGFPVVGVMTTHCWSHQVTDSAAAGTAMATGYKTRSGTISMDPEGVQAYPTIAELAKAAGRKVGIVSSSSINDATPSTFYAHEGGRNDYHSIAFQLARSPFDYFAGSGVSQARGPMGNALDEAAKNGLRVVTTREQLAACKPGQRVLFQAWVPQEIDRPEDRLRLMELTEKGIELLEGPAGFFMVVEGGRIDGAGHTNDVRTMIGDVQGLDEAVRSAVRFYEQHPRETLIVVTSDHETGGLTLGSMGERSFLGLASISGQKHSWGQFNQNVLGPFREKQRWRSTRDDMPDELKAAILEWFGLDYEVLSEAQKTRLEEAYDASMKRKGEPRSTTPRRDPQYASYEPLPLTAAAIVAERAGVSWMSTAHTFVPVPVRALGVGAERFGGFYDNTDVARKLAERMGLKIPAVSEPAAVGVN